MLTPAKWAMGIVGGGLALGALLGDAANPKIKDPPPQWWQLTGRNEIVPSSDHAFFEAGPEDLSPYDGYRPDLDYDALVWELPIPAYEMAALIEQPAPVPDNLPTVTYGVAADPATEVAADQAEAVAREAAAAEAERAAPVEEQRTSQVGLAGIY